MPFLADLAKKGTHIRKIVPSPGFCERSEIFSGLDCYDTANFTAIGYSPEFSPYKKEKFAIRIATVTSKLNSRVVSYLFYKFCQYKQIPLKPYRIPYKSLSKFALTEDGGNQYIKYNTIYDELNKLGLSYSLDKFTSLSDLQVRNSLPLLAFLSDEMNKSTDFIPVYIGAIDSAGHEFGDNESLLRPYLLDIDAKIETISKMASDQGYAVAVLGDHGMVPVTDTVDILKYVLSTGLKPGREFDIFLDSTMARFWFYTDAAEKAITNILKDQLKEFGVCIHKGNCVQNRIPMDVTFGSDKPLYGDLLWCANPGILIAPDYFNPSKKQIRGMHGYLETDPVHGTGLFVSNILSKEKGPCEQKYLKDICEELCKILTIPTPNKYDWERQKL